MSCPICHSDRSNPCQRCKVLWHFVMESNSVTGEQAWDRVEQLVDELEEKRRIRTRVKRTAMTLRGYIEKTHYKEGLKRCESCQMWRSDVERVVDPYASDVYGDHSLRWLCGDCQASLAQEI